MPRVKSWMPDTSQQIVKFSNTRHVNKRLDQYMYVEKACGYCYYWWKENILKKSAYHKHKIWWFHISLDCSFGHYDNDSNFFLFSFLLFVLYTKWVGITTRFHILWNHLLQFLLLSVAVKYTGVYWLNQYKVVFLYWVKLAMCLI